MSGNGAALKIRAYTVRYIDGSEERVEADALAGSVPGLIAVLKGPNVVVLLSVHNLMQIVPEYGHS